jgi:hypothetical protein
VATEAASRCHLSFLDVIKPKVFGFKSLYGQGLKPEQVKSTTVAAADSVVHQRKPLNSRHVRELFKQELTLFDLILELHLRAVVASVDRWSH